jgi:hypothetical protein
MITPTLHFSSATVVFVFLYYTTVLGVLAISLLIAAMIVSTMNSPVLLEDEATASREGDER